MAAMAASPDPRFPAPGPAAGSPAGARDPWARAVRTGVWLTRLWGVLLVAVGLWFFASTSLGYALPAIDWDLVWPAALILLGAAIIGSALTRRR
jgi:uncharacterized integral membrane protein